MIRLGIYFTIMQSSIYTKRKYLQLISLLIQYILCQESIKYCKGLNQFPSPNIRPNMTVSMPIHIENDDTLIVVIFTNS